MVVSALLTLLGTGVLALFLNQQITTGLFASRFEQVQSEATRGLTQAASVFENADTSDPDSTVSLVTRTLGSLAADTGSTIARDFVLIPVETTQNAYVGELTSGVSSEIIPQQLVDSVRTGGNQTYWQSIDLSETDGQSVPGLAFGTQVVLPPGNLYGLYLIYDLESVQQTLDLIMRIMAVSAALLIMINMLIALYVTRAVVRPVTQAASTAQSLSAGDLSVRMQVRGETEMARLGSSFNQMADNIQDQITQLADLSQIQQRFVSDVSHELRTPLTTVRMAAEVLYDSRDDFDAVNRRSTELLYHQVERFQALLADLLEITRFDAGAATTASEPTDLQELATDVALTALPLADAAGSTLHVVPTGGDFVADVDPRRIERIVRNLVNNAIEHGEGGPIDIVVGADEQTVAVAVRDYGIGMSPEQVSHVFNRFWRADPSRVRTTGGSGLGLSIAMEDTRLHQGRLDAWGEPGEGSAFRLTVPRVAGTAVDHAPMALPPQFDVQDRRDPADLGPDSVLPAPDRINEQTLAGPARPDPGTAHHGGGR